MSSQTAWPDAAWLKPRRERGERIASAHPMPGEDAESWRFTSVRELARRELPQVDAGGATAKAFAAPDLLAMDAIRLSFVDGRLDPDGSHVDGLPEGVQLLDMDSAVRSHPELLEPHLAELAQLPRNYFAADNTARFRDGCVLHVAAGVRVERPVHLRFLRSAEGRSWLPRLLLVLEEGAVVELLEEHRGEADGLCNAVCEIHLAPRARLTHAKLVREHDTGSHVATIVGRLEAQASYAGFSIVGGGQLVRNEYDLRLAGAHARAELEGLVVTGGEGTVDHHTRIAHEVADTVSRENFRHVLDGRARGVFAGRVEVARDAQRSDAEQQNRNLLLSETARMNTMPQLMIYADDVKCSHGATLGQLDEESMFYLRSRGIGEEEARNMLIHAFVGEMIEHLPFEALRREVRGELGLGELR